MKKKVITLILLLSINSNIFAQSNKGLAEYGIQIPLLVAGFFGALLSVTKEGKTLKQNVLTVVTGAFSSTYLTPFILELFNYTSPSAFAFFGFIVGSSSIKVVDFVTNKFFNTDDSGRT
jgi:hypothetical protein